MVRLKVYCYEADTGLTNRETIDPDELGNATVFFRQAYRTLLQKASPQSMTFLVEFMRRNGPLVPLYLNIPTSTDELEGNVLEFVLLTPLAVALVCNFSEVFDGMIEEGGTLLNETAAELHSWDDYEEIPGFTHVPSGSRLTALTPLEMALILDRTRAVQVLLRHGAKSSESAWGILEISALRNEVWVGDVVSNRDEKI